MPEVLLTSIALLALALLVGPLAWRTGRLAVAALVGLIAVLAGALFRGAVVPGDALHLAGYVDLAPELSLLVAWGAFAALVRAAGRPWLPRGVPPMVVAVLSGALLGELGAAAMLGAAATSRAAAARLVMAATGGALLGRAGDPALAVIGDRLGADVWMLAPVGLVCAMLAWPMRGDLALSEPPTPAEEPARAPPISKALTGVALVVGVAAQVPSLALPALAAGALALLALGARRLRHSDPSVFVHTVALAATAVVLVAAGAPALVAYGLEEIQHSSPGLIRPALAAGGWLAAMGLDSGAAGLLAAATLDRAQSLQVEGAALCVATGAAVGGAAPLVVAGALRSGWRLMLVQGALAVALVAWVL